MNAITLLSIDVGSKELVAAVRTAPDRIKVGCCANDGAGRVRLIADLHLRSDRTLLGSDCYEAGAEEEQDRGKSLHGDGRRETGCEKGAQRQR